MHLAMLNLDLGAPKGMGKRIGTLVGGKIEDPGSAKPISDAKHQNTASASTLLPASGVN